MSAAENRSPLLVCPACGRPAEPGQHICDRCGAPMTPYANVDPVMGIMARGFAAHKATTDPQKPIVVIGMWLWMVPMFIFGLMLIGTAIGIFIEQSFNKSWVALIGIPVALVGAVMVWIAAGILWKTTLRYVEKTVSQEESADHEENIDCLQCGASFAADASACPKCGWSYAEAELD